MISLSEKALLGYTNGSMCMMAVHPRGVRPVLVLSALMIGSGCTPKYVHWEPDVSVAAMRADSLPDDQAVRVRLVNGRVFRARDIAFEGETLRWTAPADGLVSTLPLSQVDTVMVRGERRPGTGALIGALPGIAWWGYGMLSCLDSFRCSVKNEWKLTVRIAAGYSAIGAAVGSIFGALTRHGGVTFVR